MRYQLVSLLALAASSVPLASSAAVLPRSFAAITPRQGTNKDFESEAELCEGWSLRDEAGGTDVISSTLVMTDLLNWLEQRGSKHRWLKELESYVFDGLSGATGADGCSLISGTCAPGREGFACSDYYDHSTDRMKQSAYWVFQIVKGIHSKYKEMNHQLTQQTIISDLRISQMTADFGGDAKDTSGAAAWLAGAFGVAANVGSNAPGVGAGIGFANSMFAFVFSQLTKKQDGINTGEIQSALADMFEEATTAMDDTLKLAMGGSENDDDYGSLPLPNADQFKYMTDPLVAFLYSGWWLVENDEPTVQDALNHARDNLRAKVVDNILQAAGFAIIADLEVPEDQCTRDQGYTRRWMNVKGYDACLYLTAPNSHENWNVEISNEAADKVWEHGIKSLPNYYQETINCRTDPEVGDKSKPDVDLTPSRKEPKCLFNMKMYWGENKGENGCLDLIQPGCNWLSYDEIVP